jgi:biotin carboxyl carrier protein
MEERATQVSEESPPPEPTPGRGSAGLRPGGSIIVTVPVLLVVVTFLFWYMTWFGRPMTDQEMSQYLTDTSVPHKTQHALSQLAARMAGGDATARRWYPLVMEIARNKEAGLRSMAAWVMAQDNNPPEFHQALRKLLSDPETLVSWNAALGLVRFNDDSGDRQLRLMLESFTLLAPQVGTLSFRAKVGDSVRSGEVVARIRASDAARPVEVRSPVTGEIERNLVQEGARVAVGEAILVLAPGEGQVWESLRALYLIGRPQDLGAVERFARGVPGMPERIRQQALLTTRAIRARAATAGK